MPHRYTNITKVNTPEGRRYITNPFYPNIPETSEDIYVITNQGDRYDLLAQSFYGDINLWWIIATANNTTQDDLSITPGKQIRIPANKDLAISLFNAANEVR
jgi:hypothetical protein